MGFPDPPSPASATGSFRLASPSKDAGLSDLPESLGNHTVSTTHTLAPQDLGCGKRQSHHSCVRDTSAMEESRPGPWESSPTLWPGLRVGAVLVALVVPPSVLSKAHTSFHAQVCCAYRGCSECG